MDVELGRKWVDALRSGKYQQGFGSLKTKAGGYCCLGVLCDAVLTPEGIVSPADWKDRVDLSGIDTDKYAEDGSTLRDAIGMSEGTEAKLIGMNDGKMHIDAYGLEHRNNSYTFDAIAEYIEQHLGDL